MEPILNIALTAARKAGEIITNGMQKLDTVKFTEKQSNDFVSEIDLKSEQAIIDTILRAYPDHSILAEESGAHGQKNPTVPDNQQMQWIIDPLDGTKNYLHGFQHFAVSIAVKKGQHIEHGVIFDPIRKEIFTATRGRGAQLNDQRIRVSKTKQLSQSLLGTGFPFKYKDQLSAYMQSFESLFLQCSGVRRAGAATLDLAYVAAGRLDGFWEFGLSPWDMAAGSLMIKEAGGMISDFHGGEKYLDTGDIIAGNPKIFKQLYTNVGKIFKAVNQA